VSATDPGRDTYVSLATFRRDGREVRTPVWIAGEGGRFYVFSEGDAGKVKRIRATGRVRVAACNMRGAVHGEWRDGTGRIVTGPDETRRAYELLDRKYGWQMRLANVFSRLSGRYDKRAVLAIELA
jgi:hypothetical protein